METKPYRNRVNKRPNENSDVNWPKKRPSQCSNLVGNGVEKAYKFQVLLPNGDSLGLKIVDPVGDKMAVVGFAEKVKVEYYSRVSRTESKNYRREINWRSPYLCFVDAFGNKIANMFDFKNFEPNKLYILRLHDGSKAKGEETYENMWDLKPDMELLKELPQEYAFETALVDLIDNSLQAVWSKSNKRGDLLVWKSVKIGFPFLTMALDASEEKSIVKWM